MARFLGVSYYTRSICALNTQGTVETVWGGVFSSPIQVSSYNFVIICYPIPSLILQYPHLWACKAFTLHTAEISRIRANSWIPEFGNHGPPRLCKRFPKITCILLPAHQRSVSRSLYPQVGHQQIPADLGCKMFGGKNSRSF